MDNNLTFIAGIVLIVGSIMFALVCNYYEHKILPKLSEEVQSKYWAMEKLQSEMGAYNVPFKDSKMISTNNTKNEFISFCICLGVFMIFISIIGIIFA